MIHGWLIAEDFERACKSNFEEYDADKSGFIEKAELKKAIKDLFAELSALAPEKLPNLSESEFDMSVEKGFRDMDVNADGKLS